MTTHVFSQDRHGGFLPYMAALHASCIMADQMVGPFLPPLANERLLAWWKERIAEANQGTRVIVLLLPDTCVPESAHKPQGPELRGLAMLKLSQSETGSFRGHIDAVLVGRNFRRQGGARQLVLALEFEAAKRRRTLLLVDTETGSVAEEAFKKFGYVEIGKVPQFSRGLHNGKKGETFFYKELLPQT
ncbi:hypothetical protein QBC46DRAFT_262381 [Diplogelasinospora grovesii]|uniref:N-acetyltransferase domain-containing protein n=1 Tax=Diplogelasinospora grovesii TaxID=303347 RepID=A0AAN6N600_9PEZI|nr:hypothetical protein QBC46DRAFT_262381 [Diplogelasinospora grovesii]